jgi:hypothetical protein
VTARSSFVVALVLFGCGGDSIAWEYRFESIALRDEARVIEARVLRGGCSGEELAAYRFAPGERSAVAPAPLEDGRYGLEIEARDEACRWFARGCAEVEVPSDVRVVQVVVSASTAREACPATCEAGGCAGE